MLSPTAFFLRPGGVDLTQVASFTPVLNKPLAALSGGMQSRPREEAEQELMSSNLVVQRVSTPSWTEMLGTWFFAVTAVVVMPLLPILVEAARNDLDIKGENILLTTAVLAVGFGFSSESNLSRASYLLLFFFSIGLDFHPDEKDSRPVLHGMSASSQMADANISSPVQNSWLFSHPGYLLIAVCILHAIERLYWHVGQKRKFPDWRK